MRRTPPRRECEDNTETLKIQKQNTSRSEILTVQSETALSKDPDTDTMKECSMKIPNTETTQNPETPPEIYPEIYPETRSTAYATLPASTSSQEEITEIQIQPIQKHSKLSIFETLIVMFNLPENIKDLVPVSSPLPELDLRTEPQLPLEEYSLLDYLNDSNII